MTAAQRTRRPRKAARVVNTRSADADHNVLTLGGGDREYCRQPCATCPWRVDAQGEFPAEAFRLAANTAYDGAMNGFSCHTAGAEKPALCAGFILRGSTHNIAHRLRSSLYKLSYNDVHDGGHELWPSYYEMAVANGVDPDEPVLAPIRRDV